MFHLQRHHVASGSYYVGKTKPMILEAFIGTCVGVSLVDSETGIGGLIHILLPEPISKTSSFQLQKYASTGLPLFIDALIKAGASINKLVASVAGGAFIGLLNEQDLSLDIGGRTAGIVKQILEAKEIPIQKSETGGFFTCSLRLNMQNWETGIEPAIYDNPSNENIHIPTQKEINRTIDQIQPIPQIASKILRIINEDNYNICSLADEIKKDQVISAKTLQLCNSAMFAGRERIDSLDHALLILGQKNLVKLIISASVNTFFNQASNGYSLCKGGLYHHALGTAIISEQLAQFTGKVKPATAYTAGLLHDIGKVVLDQYVASARPFFYRELIEKNNILEIEQNILGTDHTEVGRKLAEKWSFAQILTDTIKHHHNPANQTQDHKLTYIVSLANLLMSRFLVGLELESNITSNIASQLEAIGLSTSQFPDIVDLIPRSLLEVSPGLIK
ncbi:MAG: HDOD domain-containing protein [Deltaproteobacteria bacterium]|nr:HDOD domain-containing protein [Deltaproteobacteria bacterium]MBW2661670.1 HDOD domain-containing protein [Deltaproteobacteria bacterium]